MSMASGRMAASKGMPKIFNWSVPVSIMPRHTAANLCHGQLNCDFSNESKNLLKI